MDLPEDLKYSEDHLWIRSGNGRSVRIGFTEYAADQLREVVSVSLPSVGDEIVVGDVVGEIESVKSAGDILSPVAGVVSAVNAEIDTNAELVNDDPYGDGWLFEVEMSDDDGLDDLLEADAYADIIDS
ncbi:glycine cleavage system H protein [Raineyella antarctica]|uniref:Glycine cleavage system H protein n=1 Tax=Raineyella antarctica TaxID=1577474 RepID=A0A1G6GPA5_9ACTN|nr:glycine cleavage system protein GcvH [Raineyella antarctica]SDB83842.1 glycine cleavage system H protein [Raineyella antarctica]